MASVVLVVARHGCSPLKGFRRGLEFRSQNNTIQKKIRMSTIIYVSFFMALEYGLEPSFGLP